jgi:hypothetical protein
MLVYLDPIESLFGFSLQARTFPPTVILCTFTSHVATAIHSGNPTFLGNKDLNGVHSLHPNNGQPSQ